MIEEVYQKRNKIDRGIEFSGVKIFSISYVRMAWTKRLDLRKSIEKSREGM